MSCLSIGIAGNIAKKDGSELSLSSFVWDASTYAVIIWSASRRRCGYSSRDCVIRVFVAAMSRRSVSCRGIQLSLTLTSDMRHHIIGRGVDCTVCSYLCTQVSTGLLCDRCNTHTCLSPNLSWIDR